MKFYAVGTKRKKNELTGEVEIVNMLIPLTETSRVLAIKQAERVARKERINLENVLPVANRERAGSILTKKRKK